MRSTRHRRRAHVMTRRNRSSVLIRPEVGDQSRTESTVCRYSSIFQAAAERLSWSAAFGLQAPPSRTAAAWPSRRIRAMLTSAANDNHWFVGQIKAVIHSPWFGPIWLECEPDRELAEHRSGGTMVGRSELCLAAVTDHGAHTDAWARGTTGIQVLYSRGRPGAVPGVVRTQRRGSGGRQPTTERQCLQRRQRKMAISSRML